MTRSIDSSRYARWTWIVAALLVLLLVVMWIAGYGPTTSGACCGASDATATASAPMAPALTPAPPMQSAAKAPGPFAVTINGGQRVIEGTVTDATAKDRVLQSARAAFGETHVVDKIAIDAATATSRCVAEEADALFAAIKTDPPIGIACDARGTITLTGSATSNDDKAARERWARDFFGPDATIDDRIEVAAAPQPVSRPEDVRCAARMPAAVTFKTASSRIDAKGRALLDAIVPCLKGAQYEIAGYTDNIGSAEDNMKLAQARAESVRAYVILKGIDADALKAVGYGADHPIGDNETPAGRASNRRIEFVKK